MIQRWNLPEEIVAAVAQHHVRASDVKDDSLSFFVDWADRIAYLLDDHTPEEVGKNLDKDNEW